jgi:hypothetical protein
MNRWKSLLSHAAKLMLFAVAFLVGVNSMFLWFRIRTPDITLCQLAQYPSLYDGHIVQVEADATGGFGVFITDSTCTEGASGIWADEYEPPSSVRPLFAESETHYLKARILVTGRFEADATPGCYVPKFAIHAQNIELKSDITTEPMPEIDRVQ